MSEFLNKHSGKLFTLFMVVILSTLGYVLYMAPVVGLENKFIYLMKEYGYIILFFWGMLEGEMGLVMAGLLTHTGDMNLFLAIFVAGLGGFAGDQVYFYIGRKKKRWDGNVLLHTVREGETLWSLGQSYGIRTKSLARLNKLKEGDALTPGTTIKIR
jgi:hypothetical protein